MCFRSEEKGPEMSTRKQFPIVGGLAVIIALVIGVSMALSPINIQTIDQDEPGVVIGDLVMVHEPGIVTGQLLRVQREIPGMIVTAVENAETGNLTLQLRDTVGSLIVEIDYDPGQPNEDWGPSYTSDCDLCLDDYDAAIDNIFATARSIAAAAGCNPATFTFYQNAGMNPGGGWSYNAWIDLTCNGVEWEHNPVTSWSCVCNNQ